MVIDDNGKSLGVIVTKEAIAAARAKDLDLLVVAPNAQPPVARFVNFAKFLYDERKKASAARAKSKKSELKELRFGPRTGDGDINRFIERAKGFIENGDRVKITVKMRGREAMFPEVAMEKLKKVEVGLSEVAKPEAPIKNIGGMLWQVFVGK